MTDDIKQLKEWIDQSNNIVFFGGAGVSTESNIPDFRSVDGLYNLNYDYPPETILSHTFFMRNPEEFFRFYKDKMLYLDAKPNAAHLKLAEWEQQGKLKAVVTQNIDGLHQLAGSRTVYELHGSSLRWPCMKCGKVYPMEYALREENKPIPHCADCGGVVRPGVVLYEEGLDEEILENAVRAIRNADTLIVGGTSLVVYPAAGLIDYFHGKHLVLINKTETKADAMAELVIRDSIGKVLNEATEQILLSGEDG